MSAPLNLARRPFRNERLPSLVLAAAFLALAAATVRHALLARDLAPGRVRDVASEVVAIEEEIQALRAQAADLRRVSAPSEALREWAAVKGLVDRRMFSWTGLFAALEQALPPGVRLVSITPGEERGRTELALSAVGRSNEDALALMASLQAHGEFEEAFLRGWIEGREGFDITCTVRYAPKPRARASPVRAAERPPEPRPLRTADGRAGAGR
jgi:Tfp pilus assembly protein PilN